MFRNFKVCVKDIELSVVLEEIKTGKYKTEIIALRQLLEQGKEDDYDKEKEKLPGFTPSGTYKGGRRQSLIVSYSGIIILDIDDIPEKRLQELVLLCKADPFVLACFISPGGQGLKVLVRVSSAMAEHKEAFNQLKMYYENLFEVTIDKSGKDYTRLCFVSWDEELYYSLESKIFKVKIEMKSGNIKSAVDIEQIYADCVKLTEKSHRYNKGDRNNFVHHLACICNRAGISKEAAAYHIRGDYNYDDAEVKSSIESAYTNSGEFDTAKPGKKKKASGKSVIIRAERYLSDHYDFRFNVVIGLLEYKPKGEFAYKLMNDYKENSLYRELQKNDIPCGISKLRNILQSDYCPQFNPFESYFKSLPAWDGKTDFIDQLAETITTTNQTFWKMAFKKWLVAVVACVLNDDVINHTVIVFTGSQGIGKTTWMENLSPQELSKYKFSGTINPNNKDTLIHLVECMLINLDELENLNRTEIGSLKELITKNQIRVRRPYGHNNETYPRRASFMGSVNTNQFLNDTTGSRRFLCFEVTGIDYKHKVNLAGAFAQALHLSRTGFEYWFTKSEISDVTANNETYQVRTVEEEMLQTWFEPCKEADATNFFNASQLLVKISDKARTQVHTGNAISIGKACHKLGFLRLKKKGLFVYAVKERSQEEVDRGNTTFEPDKDLDF
jgi:hypothetical protein